VLRLQRYLLKELLAAFVLVTLIVAGIFVAGLMLQTLQRYPELPVLGLLAAAPMYMALAMPVAVPMAFLVACLLTYGRFSDDNEFLAMQMGGVSPWHAVAPAIAAAVVVSIGTVELACDVNPILRGEQKSIFRGQIREIVGQMRSPSKTNIKLGDVMEMSWSGREGEWFTDVFVTWTSEESGAEGGPKVKRTNRVTAARAAVALTDESPMRLALAFKDAKLPTPDSHATAGSWTVYVDLEQDRVEGKSKDEMRASELYYRMQRLQPLLGKDRSSEPWRTYRLYAGEYWRRLAFGLAPLALALLAVPLGLLAHRGSRAWALVIGFMVALPVYYRCSCGATTCRGSACCRQLWACSFRTSWCRWRGWRCSGACRLADAASPRQIARRAERGRGRRRDGEATRGAG